MSLWLSESGPGACTWVGSEQVRDQRAAGPVEDLLQTHAAGVRGAEAVQEVLLQVEGVGVPLSVGHKQQHPHEAPVHCRVKHIHFKEAVSPSQTRHSPEDIHF